MNNLKEIKHFCFVNTNKVWGGGEKWHASMVTSLQKKGHTITLITYPGSDLEKKAIATKLNYFSLRVGNLSFLNPFKILKLYLFFKRNNIDAIIFNLPRDLKLAGIASKLAHIPNIIYRRGMPHPIRNTFLNKFLFTHILDKIIANSNEIKRSLLKNNSWNIEKKIVILYNGIYLSTNFPAIRKMQKVPVLGSLGRLVESKGQHHLIDIALELQKQKWPCKILIGGTGKLKQSIEKLIKQHHLEKAITLLGHITDLNNFMNKIDFFIFPSHYEGMPNALIEALYYGKPSIAFNISAMPEVISHQKSGILVPPFDITAMGKAIIELASNQAMQDKYRHESYKKIYASFNYEKKVSELTKLIL